MKWWNKSIAYWLRVVHRDLGFLMVGLCLVYGVSGFLLNHMNGKDPAFKTEEASVTLTQGLNHEELMKAWESHPELPALKKVFRVDEDHFRLMLEGGIGIYNAQTGVTAYETHEKRPVIYWFSRMHYNRVSGWSFIGDFFAVSLVFFAASGLFMVKGKSGLAGRGKWYLLLGILIPVLYVVFA